ARGFHADHFGAHVCELQRAGGAGPGPGEVCDADAVEGTGHRAGAPLTRKSKKGKAKIVDRKTPKHKAKIVTRDLLGRKSSGCACRFPEPRHLSAMLLRVEGNVCSRLPAQWPEARTYDLLCSRLHQ